MEGRALNPIQLIATLFLAILATSHAGGIAIYCGQNTGEASLSATCASRKYQFVILAFVFQFGQGRTPKLDLSGHCDASSGRCSVLSSDIRSCQRRGVKVLLSIGGGVGNYGLSSPADARLVATYLWNSYLGGTDLKDMGKNAGTEVLLSAAPQCPFPDEWDGGAINTGLFDFVWVQFYNNPPCQVSAGRGAFLAAWKKWESVPAGKIFLGLPASKDAAGTGFVPAGDLNNNVLPLIRDSPKYGGVMLWSKFYDDSTGYSSAIKSHV
nr:unnamed protein product [Digitaria exilis]